ncbi:MAG: hypothetical protein FWG88_03920 [Oscillospiraceae bacterium]|nr:hypothetical protein [Oscillospiraceae bacterium]
MSWESASMLQVIVPRIISRYMELQNTTWEIAIMDLYNSTLYKALEDPKTSLWHLSAFLLCDLLIEEINTGDISWPREQSA